MNEAIHPYLSCDLMSENLYLHSVHCRAHNSWPFDIVGAGLFRATAPKSTMMRWVQLSEPAIDPLGCQSIGSDTRRR
ncbi:hypothetical protein CEXT_221141 [Caerostris extrusa]|uniref:Uncharacterized protein n=1 Tax=Caerostris extrusa TaxID=172846 RepID=A0AAV4MEF0_CAEEX|nr:hypothetical protein CEXT_221141 [Caerostris extrusa]